MVFTSRNEIRMNKKLTRVCTTRGIIDQASARQHPGPEVLFPGRYQRYIIPCQ